MRLDTLKGLFRATFSQNEVERSARETGAFKRFREILPLPFLLSLLAACTQGPLRTIAAAHATFQRIAGRTVSDSSFDAKVDSPQTVQFLWAQYTALLASSNRAARRAWPAPLKEFVDILIDDGTISKVRKSASERFRSTTPGQAALKMMAKLSLAKGELVDLRFGAGVHHDNRLLRGDPEEGALYMRDLGFYEHAEMARIDDADSFFLLPLKSNARPIIEQVFRGIGRPEELVGQVLDDRFGTGEAVDLDAHFSQPDGSTRLFRVVSLRVPRTDRHGKPTGEWTHVWFVCNLPREVWSVEAIAALYRLRYACIERLFRSGKHLARLDHLDTGRTPVIFTFVLASLILQTLADRLTQQLTEDYGFGQVSGDRVLLTLVDFWSDLCRCLSGRSPGRSTIWDDLFRVLKHRGRHPNPHQPKRLAQVAAKLEAEFAKNQAFSLAKALSGKAWDQGAFSRTLAARTPFTCGPTEAAPTRSSST